MEPFGIQISSDLAELMVDSCPQEIIIIIINHPFID
jgi:hypothetical protein